MFLSNMSQELLQFRLLSLAVNPQQDSPEKLKTQLVHSSLSAKPPKLLGRQASFDDYPIPFLSDHAGE